MKVYIGPFPTRLTCRIHDRYMIKKYGYAEWPEKYSPTERRVELLEKAVQKFYNVINWLWFDRLEQKIKVHVDRWDTWSMDHTLAHIVVPMLKQLKETKHGVPMIDYEDMPEDLQYIERKYDQRARTDMVDQIQLIEYDDLSEHEFQRQIKCWDWIMDEMIWAFEQKITDAWEADYYGPWIPAEDGKPIGSFEWVDDEGRDKHQERMKNGFRLFGKYYEALWD